MVSVVLIGILILPFTSAYLNTIIIVSSFQPGGFIFNVDDKIVKRTLLYGFVAFITLSMVYLGYSSANTANMSQVDESIGLLFLLVIVLILLARPNRKILRLIVKIKRQF